MTGKQVPPQTRQGGREKPRQYVRALWELDLVNYRGFEFLLKTRIITAIKMIRKWRGGREGGGSAASLKLRGAGLNAAADGAVGETPK